MKANNKKIKTMENIISTCLIVKREYVASGPEVDFICIEAQGNVLWYLALRLKGLISRCYSCCSHSFLSFV